MAISILMSVFNCESMIEPTLLSILNQSYHDFELIIVNDGSTDGTMKILEKYKGLDSRIILVDKRNTGLSDSLNIGLMHCKNEYVVRHDAEDISHQNRLEILVKFAFKFPNVSCFSSKMLFINSKYHPIGIFPLKRVNDINVAIDNNRFIVAHASVMYKKGDVLLAGGYPDSLYCEDFALWYNMRGKNMKFFYIDLPLYACMRINSGITYNNLETQLINCSKVSGYNYNIKKIVKQKKIKDKILYNIDSNYSVYNFYGMYYRIIKILIFFKLYYLRKEIKFYYPFVK